MILYQSAVPLAERLRAYYTHINIETRPKMLTWMTADPDVTRVAEVEACLC